MRYNSTRNKSVNVSAAEAISKGISPEGGLYIPDHLPVLGEEDIKNLYSMNYINRAAFILNHFLTDFSGDEISECVNLAYGGGRFDLNQPAPLVRLDHNFYVMELWHGPTCAFKDLALQLLPHLLTKSVKKVAGDKKTVILVATSGDTGKAALDGFKNIPDTEIMVFYPEDGVSPIQKLQMTTQEGTNVFVCGIEGNFDDAQTAVKKIFTDSDIAHKLSSNHMAFSSANSINWGRLVPQIIYYVSAYCDLMFMGKDLSEGFNVVVPTGNFGNILAAYYAKKMGIPIKKLICASNANNVLTEFLNDGTYDRNRKFFSTMSPSMDILISSNLERLLYDLSGCNDKQIETWMNELSSTGKYTVTQDIKEKIKLQFYAGYIDDEGTGKTIKNINEKYNYLCDTHTAVAMGVYDNYVNETGDLCPAIIASTASPFKFADHVLKSIAPDDAGGSEFDMVRILSDISGVPVPEPLSGLEGKITRFNDKCTKETMQDAVFKRLKI